MNSSSSTYNNLRPYTNTETDKDLNPTLEKVKEAISKHKAAYKDCPECGTQVDTKQRSCHECSYNFFTRKKKKFRRSNPYSVCKNKTLKDRRNENLGGFQRAGFIISSTLNVAFCLISLFAVWGGTVFQMIQEPNNIHKDDLAIGAMLISMIVLLLTFCIKMIITCLRLKNLGSSKWQSLLLFIPIINLWLSYRLYVCPESYAQHRTLDKPGKILLVLFLLIMVTLHLTAIF